MTLSIRPATAADLPLGTDPASVRRRVEALELLLEKAVRIPVLNRRIGLDAVAGIVPVLGDLVTAAMGFYARMLFIGFLSEILGKALKLTTVISLIQTTLAEHFLR